MLDFIILSDPDPAVLIALIKGKLQDGWKLDGPPYGYFNTLAGEAYLNQNMVKGI
jgi:hypothetical protein